jgi:TatD DNase family protein
MIDIGANLTHKSFRGELDEVIGRASAAGVHAMVLTGTSCAASRAAWELASEHPGILLSTAGVHPHNAKEWGAAAEEEIRGLAERSEVVAIGECGLDFDRNFSPREQQLACFEAQLEIAAELGKPVFLHERAAFEEFSSVVERHRKRLARAVVHCFTGTRAALERYLALDLHIGITGWICDERRGAHLAELVSLVPASRLMIETDAPFLVPRNMPKLPKSGRNEPAFLPYVLAKVASARGEDVSTTARTTSEVARKFFGI